MSAINNFMLIGTAESDIATIGADKDNPAQVFTLTVPNGGREPFHFAVWINPMSHLDDLMAIRGRTVSVQGILRGRIGDDHKCVVKVIASDIRVIDTHRVKKGDYV